MVIAIGYGTTFTWDGDPVGELTRIGPVNITISKQDSTNLGATNAFKTMLPGLLDPGDVEIEGFFRPGDTGQAGMLADMLSRTVKAFIIAFPTAISTSTWMGNAYVTAFSAGDATPEGVIPWTATISITGKPTLGVTLSAGMTVMVVEEETGAANVPYSPACAVGTYYYVADAVIDTASDYVKFTITAAAPQVITVTCLGVDYPHDTTIQGGAVMIGAAASVTPIYIKVQEALHSARNYTLWINRT